MAAKAYFGTAEQRLAEGAELKEVEVLLALDDREAAAGEDAGVVEHLVELGVTEVLKAVAGGVFGEAGEVDGLINGREIVMEETAVSVL